MRHDEFTLGEPGDQDSVTANHLVSMARLSYGQETARYESLVEHGNKLLTSISIGFATLAVLLEVVVTHQDAASVAQNAATPAAEIILFRIYVFAIVLTLVAAFITALLASTRFKYKALEPPSEMAHFVREHDLFPNETMAALHFCTSIQESYDSCYQRNEKIRKLLKASMILLIVSVSIATIGGLVMMFFI